jgi:hypothetical protein
VSTASRWWVIFWLAVILLAGCRGTAGSPPPATPGTGPSPIPGDGSTPGLSPGLAVERFPAVTEPERYRRLVAPLAARSDSDQSALLEDGTGLRSGIYRMEYAGGRFLIYPEGGETALALTLPGGEGLNALPDVSRIETFESGSGEQVVISGETAWGAAFQATFFAYSFQPGLFRWRLEMIPDGTPPAGPEPELEFVDRASGEQAQGRLRVYAERAPMAAPHLYAYSPALDSTFFYWVDLTALNPFMQAARFTPSATPRRQGQRFGHSFSLSDLRAQTGGTAVAVYDSYLYLQPGEPSSEVEMFRRYLSSLGDIYDLMAVPEDPLADWFGFYEWDGQGVPGGELAIHQGTIRDLADEQNWVEIEGERYLRAYVADTRQTAEAITQFDVYTALARYQLRFGETPSYYPELRESLPDFFNPDFGPEGMFQNSGPLLVTGSQERGDTWYELGHALKAAELALWFPEDAELHELAIRSGQTWMDFAQTVSYRFPRFYSFQTWNGTGRQPDTGGAYAYLMLLLHEMTGEPVYREEARNALLALVDEGAGYGFQLAYETHMTAIAAAAAARFYLFEPDPRYLQVIEAATANLMRLSWLWECDYGSMQEEPPEPGTPWWRSAYRQRTFFGLNPTQQSAVITPKEQYEAWIYITETLQLAHGSLDPTVEKLLAEFVKHTLLTIPRSLPPFMPAEAMTEHPSAYPTVNRNDLSLYIPLEDLRDGWDINGAIGQEVYGAGMAPAMVALALVEVQPGLVVYSGYPLILSGGEGVTITGVPGSRTPAAVQGAGQILDTSGDVVESENCGTGLCFVVEGGGEYRFRP